MSIKSKLRNLILPIVRKVALLEQWVVMLNTRFPAHHVLSSLVPPHTFYSDSDIRHCCRNGINYSLNLNDYQQWLLYFNIRADSSFGVLQFVNDADVVLDIGGNIGQTAFMIAEKVGPNGKVFSFEPYLNTRDLFEINLSLNPKIENIEIIGEGLADREGGVEMFRANPTNSGGNRVISDKNENTAGVVAAEMTTLDNFVERRGLTKVDLMKIDVEGFEVKVLLGGLQTLKRFGPRLFIEVNGSHLAKQGNSLEELFDILLGMNYAIYNPESMEKLQSPANISDEIKDIFGEMRVQ